MNEHGEMLFTEIKTPEYKGKYCLGGETGVCFYFEKKPFFIHRWFMRLLLGFKWYNNE